MGSPWWASDRQAFKTAILGRFSGNAELAFDYVNRVIDRQISKASGLLAFNSIVFAGLQIANVSTFAAKLSAVLSLLAALFLLLLMHVKWGSPDTFQTAEDDLNYSLNVCFNRAMVISWSLALSIGATAAAIWVVLNKVA
ncbi:MAG: hypothetical protein CFE40_05300 [Burkholderiales bacterium PBB1]|nr:MAG: hypothetical protein CFE40_05300 [Burkholderiales bacterium PBB1]